MGTALEKYGESEEAGRLAKKGGGVNFTILGEIVL